MDYLDPKKKRAHKNRIMLGYGLFAVAIAFATLVLVYVANGYFIDRNTGEVIQNGLVFIDSKPKGAEVYLNGVKKNTATDTRLVIPGGKTYLIDLLKEGYRPWSRSIQLEGGSLRQLTYPRLVPETLSTEVAANLTAKSSSVLQSPDERWIVMADAEPGRITVIDTEQAIVVPQTLILPEVLIIEPTNQLRLLEWASDNRTILASYQNEDKTTYITIDTQDPTRGQNITTALQIGNDEVQFRDGKADQFYIYENASKQLFTAELSSGVNKSPVVDEAVLAYETFASDWLVYITPSTTEGFVDARFKRGNTDFLLKQLEAASSYLLSLGSLEDHPVAIISSPTENRALVYDDPQAIIARNPDARVPVATTVLRVENPRGVSLSDGGSVAMIHGSKGFASHEISIDRSHIFQAPESLDASYAPHWIDGSQFLFRAGGMLYMSDLDGSNIYDLFTSSSQMHTFFSNRNSAFYHISPAQPGTEVAQPFPAQLLRTSLLVE